MCPQPRQRLLIAALCLAIGALSLSACSTGSKLRGQADEIEHINESIEDRAYRCAPRELAAAQANVVFGRAEVRKGDFVKASEHLRRAEENARLARAMSDFDECELRDRVAETDVAEIESVDVEAVDFMWDSDGDGIPDHETDCPYEPIVFVGDPDQQSSGCPNYDVDGDGIDNMNDRCPGIAADVDGYTGDQGCPMVDADGDGILNVNDQCPYETVEVIGYRDDTGCPSPDVDNDGVENIIDECPFEPGPSENAGCPVEEEALAEVVDDRIELNQNVYFETAEAEILPQSFPLLNQVAQILEENPTMEIRVEGHTDSVGSWEYNKELSDNRAASVRQYLIERGIDSARMTSEGHSFDRPIDDNATPEGRAANRRVEIHITAR